MAIKFDKFLVFLVDSFIWISTCITIFIVSIFFWRTVGAASWWTWALVLFYVFINLDMLIRFWGDVPIISITWFVWVFLNSWRQLLSWIFWRLTSTSWSAWWCTWNYLNLLFPLDFNFLFEWSECSLFLFYVIHLLLLLIFNN